MGFAANWRGGGKVGEPQVGCVEESGYVPQH